MYEMCQAKAQHTLLHIMLRYDKNETRSLRDWTMHKWFKHEILMPVKYKIAIQCPRASKEIQQFCQDIFVHINIYTWACVFYYYNLNFLDYFNSFYQDYVSNKKTWE